MKIAILGSRGVPARYGGFETLAEQLGRRLVERGDDVTVYGRVGWVDRSLTAYQGMRLVILPAPKRKHFETVIHTFFAACHAALSGFDAVLLLNAANAPWIRILQLAGIPVALNVDGLERKRRKWGIAGRTYYRLCERLAASMADLLITDARVIERYYRRSYRTPSRMIPYGGDLEPPTGREVLERMDLVPDEYVLYVSRFEPENNPDRVAEAYARTGGNRKLVMVGDAAYDSELMRRVESLAGRRIILPGAVYGDGYRQLLFNCRLYIHATEVGGTHPALVEAMGAGRPVLYLDTPENREVAGGAGRPFRFDRAPRLEDVLSAVLDDRSTLAALGARALERVRSRYRWEKVAVEYHEVLEALCSKNGPS